MTWGKVIALATMIALIAGGALWAYRIFEAPESIDDITEKWSESGHADTTSESFVHWDEDEPPEVPAACGKCHSLYGYLDFLGADGSTLRQVDAAAPIGSVVYCNACHNEVGHSLESVVFPGGAEVSGLGRWANCMRCHQGRTSTGSVTTATDGLDPDAVSQDLGFINVHYAIAAATRRGSEVSVGYQYPGKTYVGWYPHVEDYDACTECHDPHSTGIDPATCEPCHSNVVSYTDLFEIRESDVDFDGDGVLDEGILQEINTVHDALYGAIQMYADEVAGTPIVYADSFPYWFIDTNANGEVDEGEANFGNQYNAWTPRLVRSTYNYHYVVEDPGAFAHNAAYVLQLIYDALEDLGEQVTLDIAANRRPSAASGAD
jgi:hypothetical protein